jgi:D-tagatose-1,6-bisphosphate aldolase subunit GatZ/KbaZ
MSDALLDIIKRNWAGEIGAIPSICSAQPDVIRASLLRAQTLDRPIVFEATSNQVNQEGGYTGMRPENFVLFVHDIAAKANIDRSRIILGGDHLGPQVWRTQDADAAMAKARTLVASYVSAGFTKIHLDCSEGCRGEADQLTGEQTAIRSAKLARTCLLASDGIQSLKLVVGTEVPTPGGACDNIKSDVLATTPASAYATLAAHGDAFGDMSPLIAGLVVQRGVEFSAMHVHQLPMGRASNFLGALKDWPQVCLEAHSTDYQKPEVFPRLASLGFAFQKVGPALTFACRQALYALNHAQGLMGGAFGVLQNTMEAVMIADTRNWVGHYQGCAEQLFVQRHFGLADRIRYDWPHPQAKTAVAALRRDITMIPDSVWWQVFNQAVMERVDSLTGDIVQRLIDGQIQIALDPYFFGEAV